MDQSFIWNDNVITTTGRDGILRLRDKGFSNICH